MKIRYYLFVFIITFSSCTKENNLEKIDSNFENGVFVLNEGNYTWSNASVSYINLDSNTVQNNVFLNSNRKQLGDVAQSMYVIDSLLFIVVNNSSKIEVVSLNNFQLKATIPNLLSPRYMLKIDDEIALVSDLYSRYLKIVNYKIFEVIDSIYLGKSSENLLSFENKVFVTNWSNLGMTEIENNTIQVLDATKLTIIDSIQVNREPCGFQLDQNNNLWVLCSGSFTNTDQPALFKINPFSIEVIEKYEFPINTSPKHLVINNEGDCLYFLNTHVYKMSIYDNTLPTEYLISGNAKNFYNVNVSHFTGNIFVTDAVDYTQNGVVYQYNNQGELLNNFEVKITPSDMLFINSK